MLNLSRRARELGTENAFVVLGEVEKLLGEGKSILSFCIGQPDFPTHKALLGAGVVVLEGVDLSGVPPGRYELFCGPLRIAGGDGAPARALLRTLP